MHKIREANKNGFYSVINKGYRKKESKVIQISNKGNFEWEHFHFYLMFSYLVRFSSRSLVYEAVKF
jgi:hypothetical protein